MTLNKLYRQLRRKNIRQYALLTGCMLFSVLLITALAVMMGSETVMSILPEGGDSRKQMDGVFAISVIGCGIFTAYASSLFFRAKSRESGVLLALGTPKRKLASLLFGDLGIMALVSTVAGLLLGTPMAWLIWTAFRSLIIDSSEMGFSAGGTGYLWGLAFALFCILLLMFMGWRFVRRTNIIDVVNEQRKTEPVRDVKGWYAPVGILLMAAGAVLGYFSSTFFVYILRRENPFWTSGFYLLAVAGVYLLMVYVVVRGGSRRSYYKNIITRSMMRFQGRQTVRNMCVITMLLCGAYFALFYIPALAGGQTYAVSQYRYDYTYHHRAGEDMPDEAELSAFAAEYGAEISGYDEAPVLTLAVDGYDRSDFDEEGILKNIYHELYAEGSFMAESDYNRLSGNSVDVEPGTLQMVRAEGDRDSAYDSYEEIGLVTNPVTGEVFNIRYAGAIRAGQILGTYILDDADFAACEAGLTEDWREVQVVFNATPDSAELSKALWNEIIDRSSREAAIYENYDRIEKQRVTATGEAYAGDVDPDLQVDYAQRAGADFNRHWKYLPQFRLQQKADFLLNQAVFLMIFAFAAVVCFAAVLVIAYTRCLTIALNNRQVYDDLRHLGAGQPYLYRSVRGQVSKVFFLPALIASIAMFLLMAFIFLGNSGGIEAGEWISLGLDLIFTLVCSLVLYITYRVTLHKVCRMLNIHR